MLCEHSNFLKTKTLKMSWDETQKYVLKSHLTQPKLAEHFEQAPLIFLDS